MIKEKIDRIKQLDMVDYLASLGHQPVNIKGNDYWFNCPFEGEKTASFKINRSINRWFHFALGKGGSIIDFGISYFKCSVSSFLSRFEDLEKLPQHEKKTAPAKAENQIVITGVQDLNYFALLNYLRDRGISSTTSKKYCRQVNFTIGQKKYFGIGFGNDLGGYELRASFIKMASSPKTLTTIKNGTDNLYVFEGFIDFLSFIEYSKDKTFPPADYLILNSTSFVEQAIPIMERYGQGRLFLDHDPTGRKCTASIVAALPQFRDASMLYQGHADLNAWHAVTHKPAPKVKPPRPKL